MKLPQMSDYHASIQNPKRAFSDQDLSCCSVEKDPLGLPRVQTGGFALTYHLLASNREWAVRCFHRDIPELRRRYEAISRFLDAKADEHFVKARYLSDGIRVQSRWYPIIKMTWVRGDPLNLYIEKNISAPQSLSWLPSAFLRLVNALETLGVAHGDLQHGNVMVKGKELLLIDYDGMYLPELATLRSDQIGHVNYQHPSRGAEHYDHSIDRFSALVIYISLNAIVESPLLWQKCSDSDNLLFKGEDFRFPQNSSLFEYLSHLQVATLAEKLKLICEPDIDIRKIPPIEDLLRLERSQLKLPRIVQPLKPPVPLVTEARVVSQYEILEANAIEDLLSRAGHKIQVIGRVTSIHQGSTKYGQPYMFLNFGDWRKGCFYLVVWSQTMGLFSGRDFQSYKDKWVSVTGLLSTYKNRPQIHIDMPSQIQVLAGKDDASAILRGLSVAPKSSVSMAKPTHHVSAPQLSISRKEVSALNRLYRTFPTGTPTTQPPPTGQATYRAPATSTGVQLPAAQHGKIPSPALVSLGLVSLVLAALMSPFLRAFFVPAGVILLYYGMTHYSTMVPVKILTAPFRARYASRCRNCRRSLLGSQIVKTDVGYMHDWCATQAKRRIWKKATRRSITSSLAVKRKWLFLVGLLITGILFFGVFYVTSRVPMIPVSVFEYRTDISTLSARTQSKIVTVDTHWIESVATTVTSTTTHREEEHTVFRTIRSTTTRSSQIQVTMWSTESAHATTSTYSYEVTRYHSFSQMYPTLWLVAILLFVSVSVILVAKICIR
jgi:hypothetical protein